MKQARIFPTAAGRQNHEMKLLTQRAQRTDPSTRRILPCFVTSGSSSVISVTQDHRAVLGLPEMHGHWWLLLGVACAVTLRAADPGTGTIDLPTTLRLAGASNLEVEIAREKVSEADAHDDAGRNPERQVAFKAGHCRYPALPMASRRP